MARLVLSGAFVRVNEAFLKERARRTEPRNVFYQAMLRHNTYEDYLGDVGSVRVSPPTYKAGPVSGRMEIQYARRNGWIEDARSKK